MQGYSLLGYLNAVRQRSVRTLLVEGATDSTLISRIKLEVLSETPNAPNGLVDSASMLQDASDPALHGKGNKAKIQALLSLVAGDKRIEAALAGKIGSLVDREWDGLVAGREFMDPWTPPIQNPPNFKTVGHSMENYFFTSGAFKSWLLQAFPEFVGADFFTALEKRFVAMIALASVWSIEIRDIQAITKAAGLVNRDLLNWAGDAYQLDVKIEALLTQRQVVVPGNLTADINLRARNYLTSFANDIPGMWLCHGHLGEEVLWSCIANLAGEMNIEAAILHAIERGNPQIRFKCLVDFLAREKLVDAAPIREAVEWLCS